MLDLERLQSALAPECTELLRRSQIPADIAKGDDADMAAMAQLENPHR